MLLRGEWVQETHPLTKRSQDICLSQTGWFSKEYNQMGCAAQNSPLEKFKRPSDLMSGVTTVTLATPVGSMGPAVTCTATACIMAHPTL